MNIASLQILVAACFFWTTFSALAGPAPYESVRIYVLGEWDRNAKFDPETLRRKAAVVISLKDDEALTFFNSLDFHKNLKVDRKIAAKAKPLVMIIDLFGRTQPAFEGSHDSLYCSPSYAYVVDSDLGRYIDSKPILQRVAALVSGKRE